MQLAASTKSNPQLFFQRPTKGALKRRLRFQQLQRFKALGMGAVLLFTSLCTRAVDAKSLVGHWGLGVTNAGPGFGSPQLSAEWQSTKASAIEVLFGIDTVGASNSLSLGGRYQRHLFLEEALFYSVYLGGGLLSSAGEGGTSSSGFYFETGGLASFYLEGLPNLGFQVGSGLRLESPGGSRIRTVFFGGFHYYF